MSGFSQGTYAIVTDASGEAYVSRDLTTLTLVGDGVTFQRYTASNYAFRFALTLAPWVP
ncbi:hypothetical protein TBR22_A02440 [Luteitalea sp. TBR-22]|uniref:hypothetical protein n=1 Tax=Luteitalea sp. TBR-22 TaxID=2802971 RepID=UPI001AF9B27D|nr:hypothetical protein [Luteitalea sp. TBR-22]BCS31045.1 hypothetical protein TBR22_A02440 [Luteitalea sp. TBR-22]